MSSTASIRPYGPIVIDIENITKHYVMGEETVHALRGVTLQIHRNEYLAIMGPSGSGKSTMMNMLGCLDTPTAGKYEFASKNVAAMDDDELADFDGRDVLQADALLDAVEIDLAHEHVVLAVRLDHLAGNPEAHRAGTPFWKRISPAEACRPG